MIGCSRRYRRCNASLDIFFFFFFVQPWMVTTGAQDPTDDGRCDEGGVLGPQLDVLHRGADLLRPLPHGAFAYTLRSIIFCLLCFVLLFYSVFFLRFCVLRFVCFLSPFAFCYFCVWLFLLALLLALCACTE